ncbi:MAG: hypothetical protein ACI857_000289 [Arenicella sp.]|jgi:hypothetical protein
MMSKYFYAALALYVLSFFLPVYDIIPGFSAKGYDCAYNLAFNFKNSVAVGQSTIGHILQYVIFNAANPLIIAFIILTITNSLSEKTRWLIGNIAMISSVIFIPYFFMMLLSQFSYGYFSWLTSIILLNYLGNKNSFNRPRKTK